MKLTLKTRLHILHFKLSDFLTAFIFTIDCIGWLVSTSGMFVWVDCTSGMFVWLTCTSGVSIASTRDNNSRGPVSRGDTGADGEEIEDPSFWMFIDRPRLLKTDETSGACLSFT